MDFKFESLNAESESHFTNFNGKSGKMTKKTYKFYMLVQAYMCTCLLAFTYVLMVDNSFHIKSLHAHAKHFSNGQHTANLVDKFKLNGRINQCFIWISNLLYYLTTQIFLGSASAISS